MSGRACRRAIKHEPCCRSRVGPVLVVETNRPGLADRRRPPQGACAQTVAAEADESLVASKYLQSFAPGSPRSHHA
jgi:hypothetical protein